MKECSRCLLTDPPLFLLRLVLVAEHHNIESGLREPVELQWCLDLKCLMELKDWLKTAVPAKTS